MTDNAVDTTTLSRRRWLLGGAAVVMGLSGWWFELALTTPSIGVFAWVVPPVLAARWLTTPRAEARAEATSLARIFVILVVLGWASVRIAGMHPQILSCVVSAALRLAVLAPLLVITTPLSAALTTRWSTRRGGAVLAVVVGQLVPFVVWLPALMLALETHRPQGSLEPEEIGITWPHERVAFSGSEGVALSGLWFGRPAPRGAVLLVHGVGAEKTQFLPNVDELYRRGWEVLTYDQRSHGDSGGATTTFGLAESADLLRAWRQLLDRTRGQHVPRVVFGVSMGGAAAALALPHLEGVDGIVLDSTFAEIAHVARGRLPLGPLTGPAVAWGRALSVPITGRPVLDSAPVEAARETPAGIDVLLFHVRGDPLIPFAEAEALRDAYGTRATLVAIEGNLHAAGVALDPARYAAALDALAKRLDVAHRRP